MKNVTGKIICLLAVRNLVICLLVALVLMGTALGDIPRNGLVAEWRFDGDAKDTSGNGNDGTIYGATWVDGKFGKALSFDGITNYVQLPTFNSIWAEGFTVCTYAKFERNPGGNFERIIDLGNGAGVDNVLFGRFFSTNDIIMEAWDGTNISLSQSTEKGGGMLVTQNGILVNEMAFYCGIIDKSGVMKVFRNGALLVNKEGLPVSNVVRTKNFIAQSNWPLSDSNFKGIIDEVRIYNRALSADEVKANYEAGQIIVTSSPSGAEVLINSQSKGTASPTLTVTGVSPGSYAIKCKLSGYSDYDTNVPLTSGSVASINCALNPAPTITPTPSPTPTPTPTATTPTPTQTNLTVSNLGAQSGATTAQTSTATSKSASITGKILDAKTDEPVQGATILIDGRSAATDSNGEYELTIDVGKHNLSVNKQGYETLTRSIIVPDGGTMLDLSLKPTSSDSSWLWIVLIFLIVLVSAGIIYLLYKRKKKEKVEVKKEEKKVERAVEKKKFCMFCHAPIPLDSDFCNKCGKKQDETKRFCMNCGSLMPAVPELCGKCSKMPPSGEDTKNCRNCGEVIPVVAKFCSACGAGQPE